MAERGKELVEERQIAALEFVRAQIAAGFSTSSRTDAFSQAQFQNASGTPSGSV
jgi:hypothetical protein